MNQVPKAENILQKEQDIHGKKKKITCPLKFEWLF